MATPSSYPTPLRPAARAFAALALVLPVTISHASARAAADATTLPAVARQALAIQVALDRAGFSPGEIDARMGTFTSRALDAFRQAKGIHATSPTVDPDTAKALGEPYEQP